MTRVKICGITNLADAKAAVEAGADALGFVFAESPRRVRPAEAAKIVAAVGPWVATVGVFVNESSRTVERIVRECGLSAVQLHGDETPAEAWKVRGVRVIKAFRVDENFDFSRVLRFPGAALFDARVEGVYGGTGKTFDWRLLKKAPKDRPVILSGGLSPRNVAEAVRRLRPYGVDASSSLEKSPGKKDPKLVREFIRNAKKK